MKRQILTVFSICMFPIFAMAQGIVTFASHDINDTLRVGSDPFPSGYTAALYWGSLGSLEGSLVQIGATTGVQPVTGHLVNGGVRTTGSATAPGASATFQIRAWNGGWATYEDAVFNGANYGRTQLFVNDTGNPMASPPEIAPTLDWGPTIPEPGTFTFSALGIAALALLRRKK